MPRCSNVPRSVLHRNGNRTLFRPNKASAITKYCGLFRVGTPLLVHKTIIAVQHKIRERLSESGGVRTSRFAGLSIPSAPRAPTGGRVE